MDSHRNRARNGTDQDTRRGSAARLAVAITAGWALFDLAYFARSGSPAAALGLVPAQLVCLVVAGLCGTILERGSRGWRVVWRALALASSVAAFTARAEGGHHPALRALVARTPIPAATLVTLRGAALVAGTLAIALAVSSGNGDRRPGVARLGLGAGAAVAATHAAVTVGPEPRFLGPLALALAILALGVVRPARLRLVATLVLLASAAGAIGWKAWAMGQPSRNDRPASSARRRGAPPLLLVVLDTVRADRMSLYGHDVATTPGIDSFAREHAVVFYEARSTSPYSLPSHGSLFTGRLPLEHGAVLPVPSPNALSDEHPTLAEILAERGYCTAAVVANTAYLAPRYGMDRGFEHYDDRRAASVHGYFALGQVSKESARIGHMHYREAEEITNRALAWLAAQPEDEAWLLVLNYLDAHGPYVPPPPFDRAFSEARPRNYLEPGPPLWTLQYDRSLAYLDEHVTRLLDAVARRKDFERTAIVITSDHGEAFGRHGVAEHNWDLYEHLVHVPLILKPVGRRERTEDHTQTSGADVFHLVLDELGIPSAPSGSFPGFVAEWYPSYPLPAKDVRLARSVGRDLERDVVAWLEGSIKFIVASTGAVEAFDLAHDPEESAPLALDPPTEARARERAARWWDSHALERGAPGVTGAGAHDTRLSRDDLQRLEALGYTGE